MLLVVAGRTNSDIINMKFLVLALCVCAASAATNGYKPWQPVQPFQQAAKAVATALVKGPEAVAKAVYEPVKSVVYEPVKSGVYEPVKSAVYDDKAADILRSTSDVTADGFIFNYETGNGISAQSSGALKKVDKSEVLAIQGEYKYTAPDGTLVQFSYIADENGYQPKSNRLPVGPPIPEAILRSLEYNRAHPQKVSDKY